MSSILVDQLRPSYMSPNAGEVGVAGSQPMSTAVHMTWRANKLRRSPPYLTYAADQVMEWLSNGNASETKANESFANGVFFDIEAKRTPSIVSKLFSKRSEHIN